MTEAEWLASENPKRMLEWLIGTGKWGDPCVSHSVATDRKLRLFACACCRQVWNQLIDPRSRKAVEVAECYADRMATVEDLAGVWWPAKDASFVSSASQRVLRQCCADVAGEYLLLLLGAGNPTSVAECIRGVYPDQAGKQATVLRDIVGNPFRFLNLRWMHGYLCRLVSRDETPERLRRRGVVRSTLVKEKWQHVAWLTPAVLGIARRVYDERDFAALPVLADALEEAGCREEGILRHLRGWERCPCLGVRGATRDCVCARNSSGWQPLRGPHARGCWVLDLVLGLD